MLDHNSSDNAIVRPAGGTQFSMCSSPFACVSCPFLVNVLWGPMKSVLSFWHFVNFACITHSYYLWVVSFSIGEVRSLKLVKLYTERLVVIRFIYFHTLISGTFNSGGVDIHQQKINDLRFIPVDVCYPVRCDQDVKLLLIN